MNKRERIAFLKDLAEQYAVPLIVVMNLNATAENDDQLARDLEQYVKEWRQFSTEQ